MADHIYELIDKYETQSYISGIYLLNNKLSELIYSVIELAAGAAAAGVFMLTQPSEYEDKSAAADAHTA